MKVANGRALIPGQGALGVTELCAYLGISRTTLTRLRKDARPTFPAPVRMLDDSRLQWITAQVDEWLRQRQDLLLRRSA